MFPTHSIRERNYIFGRISRQSKNLLPSRKISSAERVPGVFVVYNVQIDEGTVKYSFTPNMVCYDKSPWHLLQL